MMEYEADIKSDGEFIDLFEKLYMRLSEKKNRSTAEDVILSTLLEIKRNITNQEELSYNKKSYSNMLPYFELGGGWDFMESQEGKEATDILWYFVNRFNENL